MVGKKAATGSHRSRWRAAALFSFFALAVAGRAVAAPGVGVERPVKSRVLRGGLPDKPSLLPSLSIPVEPLGFTPPGALYLGQRMSLASLDFLGEDRLLFTFRVPGLIHRDREQDKSGDERQIRALVLDLPTGATEAEAVWTLHDRARYLWALGDGHFLLRDGADVAEGDASLALKPLLHFPGPLQSIELDPTQKYLAANSYEPVEKSESTLPTDDDVIRLLEKDSGRVLLVSRTRSALRLPINSEGYLELLRGRGLDWTLNLRPYSGGSRLVGSFESACAPNLEFLTDKTLAASGCGIGGERLLMGISTEGKLLWRDEAPATAVWPVRVRSADGTRLAEETLVVSHTISAYAPLGQEDIKGQAVRVFDTATGALVFASAASPVLDVGGNVALSPNGRRLAVLANGAIQLFELPISAQSVSSGAEPFAHGR
jgi:hypothetical protein